MGAKGISLLLVTGIVVEVFSLVGYLSGFISHTTFCAFGAVVIALVAWAIWERLFRTQRYINASKDRVCVYVPIYNWCGDFLTKLLKADVEPIEGSKTYEIHLNEKAIKGLSARQLVTILEADLDLAAAECPGSRFIWESHIKPPRSYRRKMKQKESSKTAYLQNRCDTETLGAVRCKILKLLAVFQPGLRKFQKTRPIWIGIFVN